jgi:putative ABC transport system permease protein
VISFLTRLRWWLQRRRKEDELREELEFHLAEEVDERQAEGLAKNEATWAARLDIGNATLLREDIRPLWSLGFLEQAAQDARYTFRNVRRSPAFACVAILTLAIGIGATTAIFSVLHGVLLKPLPFHEPEGLVAVWHRAAGFNVPVAIEQGAATYLTYRESNQVFDDIGLWTTEEVSVTGQGEPERAQALWVTNGVLPILQVPPRLGRSFTSDDDQPGSPRRAILTHGYWQRRFGGTSDVVGRSLTINGTPYEVIGILPSSFKFLHTDPALLLPLRFNRAEVRVGDFSYRGLARLKSGVTLEQANADVARMIPLAVDRFPFWPGLTRQMFDDMGLAPNVRPLSQDVIGEIGRVLWILLGTVGIVLLIACANVANLFLVRAEGRQQEITIRVALGASRRRLSRELLSESVGLALAGGALGLTFAWAGIRLLARMAPAGLPRIDEISIDPVVLAFTLAVSLLTGLMFGFIPVVRLGSSRVALIESGRSVTDAPRRHRARNALVVSEIALALVLLIVSGLMIRTFIALRQVEPGFTTPDDVQTFRIAIPAALITDPQQTALVYQQITERLQQVPGVVSAGLSSSVTMDGNVASTPIFVEDFPDVGRQLPPVRRHKRVAPGYFETMGNQVLAGRAISWADIHTGGHVVVVSENFAREYWNAPAAAVGKRIRQNQVNPWREVIGVVGDERDDGLNQPATPIVYWPMLITEWWNAPVDVQRTMTYVVRSTRVGSPGFLRELQQAVWSVNRQLPLASARTLADIRAGSMAQTSFALVMLAIAALIALLLGVVGIFGVVTYVAVARTREIGLRLALGAQVGDVRRMFLRQGLTLIAVGIALGMVAAMGLTRMSSLLYGVGSMDPTTYASVAALLAGVALVATYVPARRAMRVDPMVALRHE